MEDQEKEIWKPIKNYEGLYSISNKGRVRRDMMMHPTYKYQRRVFKPIILKTPCTEAGYQVFNLSKHCYGKRKMVTTYVHRVVAEAFIDNPLNKKEVNHIDCNTKNNNSSNLEWCTRKENMEHCSKMGRVWKPEGEESNSNKLNNYKVIKIREIYELGIYGSKTLAKLFDVTDMNIRDIIKRKSWKHI